MNRLVMIADVVDSRRLGNRQQVQGQLNALLAGLNACRDQLLSPYTVTLGDEFQALFDSADRVFPDLFTIMRTLYPVRVRFALAIGPLSTSLNREQAIGMDGVAFHRARDLLERMKKQDLAIAITGLPEDDGLLEGALGLLNHEICKWRPNRHEILRGLLRDSAIVDMARNLDITEQSVYKNIRDGALYSIIRILNALTERMNAALAEAD